MSTARGAPGTAHPRPTKGRALTFDVTLSPEYGQWGGLDVIIRAAKLVDKAGYFGLVMGEHLVTPLGSMEPPSRSTFIDFFVLASHLAAVTRRVRFITGVMMVPARPAVLQAKLWASLDQVSKGRAILGAGLAVREMDLDAVGIPFKEQEAVAGEYIQAMRALWTQDRPAFQGKYVSFRDVEFWPKCVQKPHVPIWITGGSTEQTLRRVWELGADGWMTGRYPPEELAEWVARIKEEVRARGRDPSGMAFGVSLGVGPPPREDVFGIGARYFSGPPADTPERAMELIGRYRDAGINHISLKFAWETPKEFMERTEWFAAGVLPAFG